MKLRISAQAQADLRRIHATITSDHPTAASRQVAAIRKRFKLLTQHPLAGERVDDLYPGTRRFSVGSYVIYFQVTEVAVEIQRVLHGAQDANAQFE